MESLWSHDLSENRTTGFAAVVTTIAQVSGSTSTHQICSLQSSWPIFNKSENGSKMSKNGLFVKRVITSVELQFLDRRDPESVCIFLCKQEGYCRKPKARASQRYVKSSALTNQHGQFFFPTELMPKGLNSPSITEWSIIAKKFKSLRRSTSKFPRQGGYWTINRSHHKKTQQKDRVNYKDRNGPQICNRKNEAAFHR